MYLADTLSRAFVKNTIQSKGEEETETIHAADFLPISELQLREIQAQTARDDTLQPLKKTIISGWSDTKKEVPTCLHPYFLVRDELPAQDCLILKGHRCVIPLSLRTTIKEKLHGAHTGIQSCLRRARETVYAPGMNSDLTDHIRSATSVHPISQTKQESLSSHMRLLIDLGKRLVQMFSHLMVQTTSVWVTTTQVTLR